MIWLKQGDVVDQRYRILDLVAKGGQSAGYVAERIRDGEKVFLKEYFDLPCHALPEQALIYSLMRERIETKDLNYFCFPLSKDYGAYNPDMGIVNGSIFSVFPFIEGKTFGNVIKKSNSISIRRYARILLYIAARLEKAGIAHLDLNPDNIMVSNNGRFVTLIDMDYARVQDDPADPMSTYTGIRSLGGRPFYRAPEVAAGNVEEISSKSDSYSLAIMLVDMLMDGNEFRQINPHEDLREAVKFPANDLHPDFLTTLQRCLSTSPHDRYSIARLGREVALHAGTFFRKLRCGINFAGQNTSYPYFFADQGNGHDHISGEALNPIIRMLPREPCLKLKLDTRNGFYSICPLLDAIPLCKNNKRVPTGKEVFLEIPDDPDRPGPANEFTLNGIPLRIYLEEDVEA